VLNVPVDSNIAEIQTCTYPQGNIR